MNIGPWNRVRFGLQLSSSELESNKQSIWVAAIAPWFRLGLPSCSPRFESQAHDLRFFQFVLMKLYRENNEKTKRGRAWPFFLKKTYQIRYKGPSYVSSHGMHQMQILFFLSKGQP